MTYTVSHYISGKIVTGGSGFSPIYNPATGEQIGQTELADQIIVESAIAAAQDAFASWSQSSLGRRTAILFKFRELLAAHTDELAQIISREHGKVLSDAAGEVGRGLDVVEYVCGVPSLLKGEFSMQAATGMDVFSFREPIGVCAGITPFNFPVMCPMWMAPVAIACGNTFVLKPAKADPSAALYIAGLWAKAGLPAGVFNVVQGDRHAVAVLDTHPGVKSLSFVGSTPVGKELHDIGVAHGKRVQALCGAKNHGVILADADLDFAAASVVSAAFGAAGERCMALPVAIVVDEIADQFLDLAVQKAKEVKVAVGTDPDADMGAIITRADRDRIEETITDAENSGARIVLDGRGYRPKGYENGFFTGPTIIDQATTDMRCYVEEIFGPVLVVLRVPDLESGIQLIKNNPYGNGAAIFTSSGDAAREFQRAIPVGMIGINVPIPVPVAYHSFGGWQNSFFGESHIYGPEGVKFFTQAKVITQRWPQAAASQAAASQAATFHFAGASSASS
ncbi:MAG: CoA-acylating methylmalonate-semialdehyde dehydrogenase [Propionibacteriaceae bacterium]|jgi:malonate-semialdehyde dehydrogenase (acetylating)/methylmalonate-semialdehyde dehydrogenase|nr:CoA-acylating methylmalonate-semialdehyde dehydrogenase [Propionibacteriaceae bacterium]